MFHNVKMCSVVPLPFLKPACSGCRRLSTVVFIRVMTIFENILFGMGSRVIPLQLLQSAKFPFFSNLIILLCVQSSGSYSFSHISTKRGCRISAAVSGSVLKTSAHNESVPGALLFPRVAIAALTSAFSAGDVSISRSLQAGCLLDVVDPVCLALHRSVLSIFVPVQQQPFLSMSGG